MEMSSKLANRLTLRSVVAWIRTTLPVSAAKRIALQVTPELWDDARRKLGKKSALDPSFRDYVQVRSAQLVQPRVDEMVRTHARLSGAAANKLILNASRQATNMILAKAKELGN